MTKQESVAKEPKKGKSKHREALEGLVFIFIAILLFSVPKIIAYHPDSIAGNFIIANNFENDEDPLAKTIIFITKHDKMGATGYVINKTLPPVKAQELYDRFNITPSGRSTGIINTKAYAETFISDDLQILLPIYWGGDIERNKPHLILSSLNKQKSKHRITGTSAEITTKMQTLNGLIQSGDKAPSYKIMLGHSNWGAGQLDKEIAKNMWLVHPYSHDILFSESTETLWKTLSEKLSKKNNEEKE